MAELNGRIKILKTLNDQKERTIAEWKMKYSNQTEALVKTADYSAVKEELVTTKADIELIDHKHQQDRSAWNAEKQSKQ